MKLGENVIPSYPCLGTASSEDCKDRQSLPAAVSNKEPENNVITDSWEHYGNCLQIVRHYDDSQPSNNDRMPSHFALRPRGPYRNVLALSKLTFPYDNQKHESSGVLSEEHKQLSYLDLKSPIRQLARSGNDQQPSRTAASTQMSDVLAQALEDVLGEDSSIQRKERQSWFMARTPTHCSVCQVSFARIDTENEDSGLLSKDFREDVDIDEKTLLVPILDEACTIDLRERLSSNDNFNSMAPAWCTGYRGDIDAPFGAGNVPVFAIGTAHDQRVGIHQISIGGDGETCHVHDYFFDSIAFLRQIEYALHPMRVWVSATRRQEFGESVFQLDLRQPSSSSAAVRFWSPSHANYMMDGICSVQSLLQHPRHDHKLFVSSSLSKVYELDVRMPKKEVCSWELAAVADPPRRAGNQRILSFVENCQHNRTEKGNTDTSSCDTLLSIELAPESYGLHLHQTPNWENSIFDVLPVETGPELMSGADDKTFVSLSSLFALPDISASLFFCGLASLSLPIGYFLPQHLIQDDEDEMLAGSCHATCVLQLTSVGDLYCTTLIEKSCRGAQSSVSYKGLPVGSSVIAAPFQEIRESAEEDPTIAVTLSNYYPAGYDAFLPPMPEESVRSHAEIRFNKDNEKKMKGNKSKQVDARDKIGFDNLVRHAVVAPATAIVAPLDLVPVQVPRQFLPSLPKNDTQDTAVEAPDSSKSDITAGSISKLKDAWDEDSL
jgi:hypothetical protein